MQKAQFLVVAILAAVVMALAFAVYIDHGKTPHDWPSVSSFTREAAKCRLPDLSGSVTPSSTSAPGDQTDNTTATFTSGGAVRASFTVVPQPEDNQEESTAAEGQAIPNSQSNAAAQVRPEPRGLPNVWRLVTAASSVWIIALCGLAFLHLRAKAQT